MSADIFIKLDNEGAIAVDVVADNVRLSICGGDGWSSVYLTPQEAIRVTKALQSTMLRLEALEGNGWNSNETLKQVNEGGEP